MTNETTVSVRKVAINGCYGGFGLSDAAFIEFMRRKGVTVYAEPGVLGSSYWVTPIEQQPDILRTAFYEVPRDKRDEYYAAREAAGHVSQYDHLGTEHRDDPDLIAVLEQFGEAAAGRHSAPRVVEIPADVDWQIDEYDGIEWVAEKHRQWS